LKAKKILKEHAWFIQNRSCIISANEQNKNLNKIILQIMLHGYVLTICVYFRHTPGFLEEKPSYQSLLLKLESESVRYPVRAATDAAGVDRPGIRGGTAVVVALETLLEAATVCATFA
jgi:hypothetical protein